MIALADMLVTFAEGAGMKVPPNADEYDKNKFPHWHVYTTMQLGRRMPSPDSHARNAHLIAKIPAKQIRKLTYGAILAMGFE